MRQSAVPTLLLVTVFGASSLAAGVTPLQKVVQLLEGMLTKAKQAKHEEQLQFAKFQQFCADISLEKQNAVEAADGQIELLKADVQKFTTEIDRLGGDILQHEKDIAGWEKDLKDAKTVRESERSDYTTTHLDYVESLGAIGEAIRMLKAQNFNRKGTYALLEKVSAIVHIPEASRRAIDAFLVRGPDEEALDGTAPTVPVNAYEFQSSDIIKMLEELKVKFADERAQLEKDEVARRHASESLVQDLTQSVDAGSEAKKQKTQERIKDQQGLVDSSSQLADVSQTREDDFKYLTDLTATCKAKTATYEARQTTRDEEMSAIEKATEILSSDVVQGNAEKHLPSLAQHASRATSLVQLRSTAGRPAQLAAAAYLLDESKRLGSRTLSTIALRARDDPFTKVKQLIWELLQRLQQEATNEATHKGWCDSELATNEHTRKTKTAEVEMLRSEIDELDSRVAVLKRDIAKLHDALAVIDAAVAKATEIREEEKQVNAATVTEAQEAQTALNQAIKVLKDFYSKAGDTTSLVQGRRERSSGLGRQEPPPIFDDEPVKGMQAESGNVLGFLEVIVSDFGRLESDTKTDEEAAKQDYDKFMEDSQIDKTQKQKDVEHQSAEQLEKQQELDEKKTDLQSAEGALDAAAKAYESLKPACLAPPMTYAERKARREDEVAALKEGLRILEGEDLAALQQQ